MVTDRGGGRVRLFDNGITEKGRLRIRLEIDKNFFVNLIAPPLASPYSLYLLPAFSR